MLDIGCTIVKESVLPSQEAFNTGASRPYPPLVSACISLITSLACDNRLRALLRDVGIAETLASIVVCGGNCSPSSVTPAAVTVGLLVGGGWPGWASPVVRARVMDALVEALRRATFSSKGGYKSSWMICMAIGELCGLALNRRALLAAGLDKILDLMLVGAANVEGGLYPPTQAHVLMCLWNLHFDARPYEIAPRIFGTDRLADIEQVHLKLPRNATPP